MKPTATALGAALVAALAVAATVFSVQALRLAEPAEEPALHHMAQQCSLAMAQTACRVEGSSKAEDLQTDPPPVFVVGVGEVDGRAYRQLRDAGATMCDLALQACRAQRGGSLCTAALRLWGSAEASL